MNRIQLTMAGVCALVLCGGMGYGVAAQTDSVPVQQVHLIKVSAKRFVFTPAQLTLKKDETVDIEITVDDVPMGFSVPDMNTRTDLVPGTVAKIRLTPNKVGTFPFLCDIFCGSGHEDMNGVITVTD